MKLTLKEVNLLRVAPLVGAMALCSILSACNTVAGVGKDLKNGGESLQQTADNEKYRNSVQAKRTSYPRRTMYVQDGPSRKTVYVQDR
jgi:predicted small secreted protein